MPKLNVKIQKDNNEIKYIAALRKNTNMSMIDIKNKLNNNDYILSCNLLDVDELVELKKNIEALLNVGAKVDFYEDDRQVSKEFLDNLIESHYDTERYLEEIDNNIIDEN